MPVQQDKHDWVRQITYRESVEVLGLISDVVQYLLHQVLHHAPLVDEILAVAKQKDWPLQIKANLKLIHHSLTP